MFEYDSTDISEGIHTKKLMASLSLLFVIIVTFLDKF